MSAPSTHPLALIALLAMVACGPPEASDGGDDEGTSTDGEAEDPSTTTFVPEPDVTLTRTR
jgi:hypothetical protein